MNKIKKFNEHSTINEMVDLEQFFYIGNDFSRLTVEDFKKVHDSGRKVYYISNQFELIEIPTYSRKVLFNIDRTMNRDLPQILFISDDTVEKIIPVIKNIGDIKELHLKEVSLRLKQVLGIIQKKEPQK